MGSEAGQELVPAPVLCLGRFTQRFLGAKGKQLSFLMRWLLALMRKYGPADPWLSHQHQAPQHYRASTHGKHVLLQLLGLLLPLSQSWHQRLLHQLLCLSQLPLCNTNPAWWLAQEEGVADLATRVQHSCLLALLTGWRGCLQAFPSRPSHRPQLCHLTPCPWVLGF